MSMEIDSGSATGSATLEQITNQIHAATIGKPYSSIHTHACTTAPCPEGAAITSKLRSDAAFIGNHEQQWFFINEMLAMKVRRRVAPEYNNGPAVNYNPAHFLEHVDL
ncbi:hypothetical protein E4U32_000182 [Claviceps aff. humidiphila group G2b]|nr:hypothetical protein E4U32_000182 [Claviceps aff. humidiphila group G2b]